MYKVRPDTEYTLAANLTASSPSFTVSGLDPGSSYAGELIPHNVKGTGRATRIQVYTLKLPEKLIPHIEKGPAPGKIFFSPLCTNKVAKEPTKQNPIIQMFHLLGQGSSETRKKL